MNSWRDSMPKLEARLTGPSFMPDTSGYDSEVAVFNMAVQHQPAVVVGATNAEDVAEAVRFAPGTAWISPFSIPGTDRSLPALNDTLMITTSRMSKVDIDAGNRTARVGAGVRFGQLVDAAAPTGWHRWPGSSPGVGVVGYTLGGGASSTIGRKYGWASDHVRALDVVTADGRLRRVSAQSEADLFGALLGGKSNFGIVTAMELALFPVTQLYAGSLFYSGEDVRDVLKAYRRFTTSVPEEISTGIAF